MTEKAEMVQQAIIRKRSIYSIILALGFGAVINVYDPDWNHGGHAGNASGWEKYR